VGEAHLVLPELSMGQFPGDLSGTAILIAGIVICMLGILFGLVFFNQLRRLPVHVAMRDISELIYQTCKTYLVTQGRFILILECFIGIIIASYFALQGMVVHKIAIILLFTLLGIGGSYGVAWFGIRINNYANSGTAFASLRGKPYPVYSIPLRAGISIGMLLISIELLFMLLILLCIPRDYAGPCFIGFAVGASLGASALRIAGGIFTKIADIGSDLMKIVFNIKEDDARNPGVIADCTGDNAGDSVGPTADAFETYGVTCVALITFIMIALKGSPGIQVRLIVWIFSISATMVFASAVSYLINEMIVKSVSMNAQTMNFEKALKQLVWTTSIVSIGMTYLASFLLISDLGDGSLWWKLASIICCGTLAGAVIPEVITVFTSTGCSHVREIITASREGGASLNILSGLTAGNFSAYWMGMVFILLMSLSYGITTLGLGNVIPSQASAVFAFGLVAFGFLSLGPVTIAVDSYGPVTDNAQSVYELSLIEEIPDVEAEIRKEHGFDADFSKAKHLLEENDGAGNTFKATAKPVLIGTAVVGATTMIFSIVMTLTSNLSKDLDKLSLMHPPFLLGLIAGGAVIYWFSGATIQAVSTGAYRAVEFIKRNIKIGASERAPIDDSKKVVQICTEYAQKGMFNIFMVVFFCTLAFACVEPYFFIGYLIAMALFGLFQALFMANAGGAWDNAKKVVEVELNERGTPLHTATVVGDTVGDPFKDTSSVAMNPVIKFTTLFGLLAVELALELSLREGGKMWVRAAAVIFFAVSVFFVWRSFYGMRIRSLRGTPSGAPTSVKDPVRSSTVSDEIKEAREEHGAILATPQHHAH
jgi:K(+)-stimulated pyrophosphate-energized sodium pump